MVIVFGGSFNPPTKAHLNIILKLLSIYPDSQVLILPVGNDYHKKELIDINHRLNMLKLLTKSMPRVMISDLEAHASFKGTIASLDELSKHYEDIHFVIGMDNLLGVRKWIQAEKLLKKYPFIVMNRRSHISIEDAERQFQDVEHHFDFIEFDADISASDARKNPHERNQILTEEVIEYINQNHLYKEPIDV